MHKFSKISTFALFGLVTVGGAAGCSGGRGPVAFQMWSGFGSTYSMYLDKLIDYEWETNQLNIAISSKGSYENLQKAINESIPTLDYPTVANGYPDHFAGYIRTQVQLPLNDFIKEYDAEHGTNLMDDYYENYMVENMTLHFQPDGTPSIMGLPFNKSTELLGYNGFFVDYAISKGVIADLPETWQEWASEGPALRDLQLSMCGKYLHGEVDEAGNASNFVLNDVATGDDILMDMHDVTPETCRLMSWDASDNMFITVVRQWGGVYTSYSEADMKMPNPHGWVEFNNTSVKNDKGVTVNSREKTIAALTFFNGLFGDMDDASSQIFGLPANFGGLYSSDAFKANKVMFTVCSSGGLSYNTGGGQRFRLAPIPYYDDGELENKYVISQGTNLALFDQGDAATLKKAFSAMVDFTTGGVQASWACDTGYFPGAKSAANAPAYKEMLESTDYSNANVVAYRESAQINEDEYMVEAKGWTKFVDPGFVGSSTIRATVKNILANVFNHVGAGKEGEKTYEAVLNEAYTTLKDYVHNM